MNETTDKTPTVATPTEKKKKQTGKYTETKHFERGVKQILT